MIGIHDDGVIFESALRVQVREFPQILVVIVGFSLPVFVHRAAENSVRERSSLRVDFPPRVHARMRMLCGADGVHHNCQIAACGVFHTHGDIHAACG